MPTYEIRCNNRHSLITQNLHEAVRRIADLRNAAGPVTLTCDGSTMSAHEVECLRRDTEPDADTHESARPCPDLTRAAWNGGPVWDLTEAGWTVEV